MALTTHPFRRINFSVSKAPSTFGGIGDPVYPSGRIVMSEGDRLEVVCHFGLVDRVLPPEGLDVIAVAFAGDTHTITYEAERALDFDASEMFIDPVFNQYRQDLKDFYEYRNSILRGEVGRRRDRS